MKNNRSGQKYEFLYINVRTCRFLQLLTSLTYLFLENIGKARFGD